MRKFFLSNPWVRTVFPLIPTTIASLAANALIVEISQGNIVNWYQIWGKFSFYLLMGAIVIVGFYQFFLFRHDNSFLRGITTQQFDNLIRREVLEEAARAAKQLIREHRWDELKEATSVLKDLFGKGAK